MYVQWFMSIIEQRVCDAVPDGARGGSDEGHAELFGGHRAGRHAHAQRAHYLQPQPDIRVADSRGGASQAAGACAVVE